MNPTYLIPIFMLLLVLIITQRNQRGILKKLIKQRKREDKKEMIELAKRFIDRECLIYTFNSQITGVIKEVSDGAILLSNNGTEEAVNIDFIVRIREYPRKKNGKKRAIVLD